MFFKHLHCKRKHTHILLSARSMPLMLVLISYVLLDSVNRASLNHGSTPISAMRTKNPQLQPLSGYSLVADSPCKKGCEGGSVTDVGISGTAHAVGKLFSRMVIPQYR